MSPSLGICQTSSPAIVSWNRNAAITNVTKDQIFSPPVLATHEAGFRVFMAGAPASAELVKVAEDGMNGPLATMLGASPRGFRRRRGGRSDLTRRNGVLRNSLERQGGLHEHRGNARQHERRVFRRQRAETAARRSSWPSRLGSSRPGAPSPARSSLAAQLWPLQGLVEEPP